MHAATQTGPEAQRLLGKGLALVPIHPGQDIGLDIAFGPSPSANASPGGGGLRDLVTVAGLDTLLQDLTVALSTGLGTEPLNTGFGSDAFRIIAEESDPILLRERIRVAVMRVVAADPRVARLVSVTIDDTAPLERSARRTDLAVEVVFETILGTRATMAIEGLADV